MSRSARRTRLPALLVLALVLVAAGGAWWWLRDVGPSAAETQAGAATDAPYDGSLDGGGTVAGTPASGGEDGDAGLSPSATPSATPTARSTSSPAALRPVDVAPTYSGWDPPSSGVVVGGIVTGVIEDGGTCTVTLTRDGLTAEGSSAGVPDARNSSCGEIRVPGAALSSGEWSAVLTYRSATSSGESASFPVVVP
jgi:hypothetical protein